MQDDTLQKPAFPHSALKAVSHGWRYLLQATAMQYIWLLSDSAGLLRFEEAKQKSLLVNAALPQNPRRRAAPLLHGAVTHCRNTVLPPAGSVRQLHCKRPHGFHSQPIGAALGIALAAAARIRFLFETLRLPLQCFFAQKLFLQAL